MADYRLLIKPSAAREIEAIGSRRNLGRVIECISALAIEPRPMGCEKLSGAENRWRIRQGDYRIVYCVDDAEQVVEVVKVGHRREVYRKV